MPAKNLGIFEETRSSSQTQWKPVFRFHCTKGKQAYYKIQKQQSYKKLWAKIN
jgi:hypothetical protein